MYMQLICRYVMVVIWYGPSMAHEHCVEFHTLDLPLRSSHTSRLSVALGCTGFFSGGKYGRNICYWRTTLYS